MILHTDTALLSHRPVHLQLPSEEERMAARYVTPRRTAKAWRAGRIARLFAFRRLLSLS
ncbi:hypothetical protein KBY31_06970 [Ruegeria pomeroyi]|nr:hypothetical protein [Ruegeria pomeroyi]